jgi:hypothetical protein
VQCQAIGADPDRRVEGEEANPVDGPAVELDRVGDGRFDLPDPSSPPESANLAGQVWIVEPDLTE